MAHKTHSFLCSSFGVTHDQMLTIDSFLKLHKTTKCTSSAYEICSCEYCVRVGFILSDTSKEEKLWGTCTGAYNSTCENNTFQVTSLMIGSKLYILAFRNKEKFALILHS